MIDYQNIPSPSFVLEEDLLKKNLTLIKGVQDRAGVSIILALKAFSMWRVFPLVGEYLSGATASSLNEARLIYEEMGRKAHTYSPAYLPNEFMALLDYSSHITFNSISQYERYKDQLAQHGGGVSPGLRVNPEESDVETDLYNPASPVSRLGQTSEHFKNGLPEGIEGLHFHTLCESSSYALEKVLVAFEKRFGHLIPQVKWVNFGGGHLMTRKDYDVEHLIKILKAFKERHGVEVILEPGSASAWQTGTLLSTVLDIVENHGVKTAIVDVSFTAHMPDTLEMPYRPKITGATDPIEGKPTYRIGGVSCLAGDYMEAYSFDQPLKVGDQLIFEDMIHYTMVKTTMFNGVTHPNIAIWTSEGKLDMVRQFTYEDFKGRLSQTMMTLAAARQDLMELLTPLHGAGEAESISRIILEDAFHVNNKGLSGELSEEECNLLKIIKERLSRQEPVQYILGMADFCGLKFQVTPEVLIPRQETEELVLWARELAKAFPEGKLLDIGTGSGCIPVTFKKLVPKAEVHALDVSSGAFEVARANAKMNEVDIHFHEIDILNMGDWLALSQFDIILSNPPYIPHREEYLVPDQVKQYEPGLALFVENEDALLFYRTIVAFAKQHLNPGGWLLFETNEFNAEEVVTLFPTDIFQSVELRQDILGKNRMVGGRKNS